MTVSLRYHTPQNQRKVLVHYLSGYLVDNANENEDILQVR